MKHQPLKRVLLIAVPGIGDALLATPLVRSLKAEHPDCEVDMLVRSGSGGIVKLCPEISRVLTFPRRPSLSDYKDLLQAIFRRYDLAISTSASDRAIINSVLASSNRVSLVPEFQLKNYWKRFLVRNHAELSQNTHTLLQNLQLADILGLKRFYETLLPATSEASEESLSKKIDFNYMRETFVVAHMIPGLPYKCWPEEHWAEVVEHLGNRGYTILFTSGPNASEIRYVKEFTEGRANCRTDALGKLGFDELTCLLRYASCYVGTDTSVTHLAAASGVPTVALFGPTSSVKWGPWPKGYHSEQSPYNGRSSIEKQVNVTLLQSQCPCIPFDKSCKAHRSPESLCMKQLRPQMVIEAIKGILEHESSDPVPNSLSLSR